MHPRACSRMTRAATIIVLGLTCGACDMVHPTSAFGRSAAPLDESCVLETLRKDSSVRGATAKDDGGMWATIEIQEEAPSPLGETRQPTIDIFIKEDGFAILLKAGWINFTPSPEYEAYLQRQLDGLRDRIIAECGGGGPQ